MFDTAAAARHTVLALIENADGIALEVNTLTDLGVARAAISRAHAAHGRIDTLILGRPAAARKRVHRLLGIPDRTPNTPDAVPVVLAHADDVATERAGQVRARLAALLTPAA